MELLENDTLQGFESNPGSHIFDIDVGALDAEEKGKSDLFYHCVIKESNQAGVLQSVKYSKVSAAIVLKVDMEDMLMYETKTHRVQFGKSLQKPMIGVHPFWQIFKEAVINKIAIIEYNYEP